MEVSRFILLGLLMLSSMAVFVFLQRLFTPVKKDENAVSELVKDKHKEISVFDTLDPERSFMDKIDCFFLYKLRMREKLETTHMLLGSPEKPNPLQMLHFKLLLGIGVAGFITFLLKNPVGLVLFFPAFILPDFIYGSQIKKRQQDILANFATFVDLSALIIESGLDYITAFDRIVKLTETKTPLEEEVDKMLLEIQLGHTRRDALAKFASRTGIQELRSFVGLIIQSDELGTSLVDLLRNFSADMRFRRLNTAEKLAAQASTKMLIPLFIFIFPTVFLLMLGPMAMDMAGSLFGGK